MYFLIHSSMEQMLFAGFPATILFDGILPCNTAPPPQIVLSPISVPGKIKNLAPIKQFSQVSENDRLLLVQLLASLSQSRNRA